MIMNVTFFFLDFENLVYGWGDSINRSTIGWA